MEDQTSPYILVIDRSTQNQHLICECLAQLDHLRPISAGSQNQALQLFRETSPSVILLDTMLEDGDGLALARAIRAEEAQRNQQHPPLASWTPIIFLSATHDEQTLAQGILAGGDDFLHKPISEIVLLAKVQAMLRIARMQQDLHAAHRRLHEISLLDGLTGIPNRRHFDHTLHTEWKRCCRLRAPMSVIIGDVDFFKQFNDTYGHQAGDTCLRAVANTLNDALFRVEDCVARYGGEEFASILPGTDTEGALAVAERMRRATRELGIPHQHGLEGHVTCSFGLATLIPTPDEAPHQLLAAADASLYRAKQAGRNRVAF